MKIFAFIVTYNRLSLLKKVLLSLKKQTQNIDKIVVVNNSSTDGTEEWLSTQKDISVITQPNVGGAGGFKTGVEYCYNSGADWIWMMDDDVFPEPNCLETLLQYSEKASCLQPSRHFADGPLMKWFGNYDIKRAKILEFDFDSEYTYITNCCFEGCLIKSSVVEKVGYPDARFFIAGDDSSYGWRVSQYDKILYIRDAKMYRAMRSTEKKSSNMYTYYTIRNRHLLREVYKDIKVPVFYFDYETVKQFVLNIFNTLIHRNWELYRLYIKSYKDMLNKVINKSF